MAVGVSWAAVFRRLRGSICMKERRETESILALEASKMMIVTAGGSTPRIYIHIRIGTTCSITSSLMDCVCFMPQQMAHFSCLIILFMACITLSEKCGEWGAHGKIYKS